MTSVIGTRNRRVSVGCGTKPCVDDVLRIENDFAAKKSASDIETHAVTELLPVNVNVGSLFSFFQYKNHTINPTASYCTPTTSTKAVIYLGGSENGHNL